MGLDTKGSSAKWLNVSLYCVYDRVEVLNVKGMYR